MAYNIEIKCTVGYNKYEWKKMQPTRGAPYRYETKEEAEKWRVYAIQNARTLCE